MAQAMLELVNSLEDGKAFMETFQQEVEGRCQLDLNLFINSDHDKKSKAKSNYRITKVKARNFFTNISYRRLKCDDAECLFIYCC